MKLLDIFSKSEGSPVQKLGKSFRTNYDEFGEIFWSVLDREENIVFMEGQINGKGSKFFVHGSIMESEPGSILQERVSFAPGWDVRNISEDRHDRAKAYDLYRQAVQATINRRKSDLHRIQRDAEQSARRGRYEDKLNYARGLQSKLIDKLKAANEEDDSFKTAESSEIRKTCREIAELEVFIRHSKFKSF